MFKGEDIRKKRKSLKLSAKELAERIEVNVDNLYKWEKGHLPNNPEDFLKVEKWLSGKTEIVPSSNNGSLRPQEAQHAPDYRDDIIALLKEKLNLTESRTLLTLETNNALLKTILQGMAKIQARVEKRKQEEVLVELNNITESHLQNVKKGGS